MSVCERGQFHGSAQHLQHTHQEQDIPVVGSTQDQHRQHLLSAKAILESHQDVSHGVGSNTGHESRLEVRDCLPSQKIVFCLFVVNQFCCFICMSSEIKIKMFS